MWKVPVPTTVTFPTPGIELTISPKSGGRPSGIHDTSGPGGGGGLDVVVGAGAVARAGSAVVVVAGVVVDVAVGGFVVVTTGSLSAIA
jgi:hypothetical protein